MSKDDALFGYRQQLFAEAARTSVSAARRPRPAGRCGLPVQLRLSAGQRGFASGKRSRPSSGICSQSAA